MGAVASLTFILIHESLAATITIGALDRYSALYTPGLSQILQQRVAELNTDNTVLNGHTLQLITQLNANTSTQLASNAFDLVSQQILGLIGPGYSSDNKLVRLRPTHLTFFCSDTASNILLF